MRARRLRICMVGVSSLLIGATLAAGAGAAEIVLPAVPEASRLAIDLLPARPAPAALPTTGVASVEALATTASRLAPPPDPVALTAAVSAASGDVTGSIGGGPAVPAVAPSTPITSPSAMPSSTVPASANAPAPASAPVAAVAPAVATPTATDMTEALGRFVADVARRPAETLAQARQRQKDREAIAAFYAARAAVPLWLDGSRFSGAAKAALARIDRASEDGLVLTAFAVPALRDPDGRMLAEAEIAVSEAVVAYGRQASGSRIDPLAINRLITAKPVLPEPADVLARVSGASDPDVALRDFNPPQPGYAALRTKLAELRQQAVPMAESIPSGPTLKPGMRDARVPLIRSRFDVPASNTDDGTTYDTKVAAAVAEFQRTNGLPPSGILTTKTIAALSGGNPLRLENELISSMERWRWLPRDLGRDHISVNLPDYSLEVVKDGTMVHRARVVVGKPDHQTPIFSDAMRFIIVNPYWNVPLSIIKKEMMPKLAENPNYFADHGYEVVERDGTTYVRQPPGEDNALGRIKFMFPNQHSVYLHDTNARALFGKDKRAFSHGCVRVDQPFKLAEVVLGPQNGWSEKRIQKMIGGTERTIMLPAPLPIHITYFTSFVDSDGTLQLRDDLYGYSAKVKLALGLKD